MKTSITGQSHYKYERGKRLRWSRQLSISWMIRKGPLTTTACTERQIGVLTCQKVIINWIALVGSFIFITAVCHPFKGMRIQTIGIYIPCMAIYGQTPMSPVYTSFTFLFSFSRFYTHPTANSHEARRGIIISIKRLSSGRQSKCWWFLFSPFSIIFFVTWCFGSFFFFQNPVGLYRPYIHCWCISLYAFRTHIYKNNN